MYISRAKGIVECPLCDRDIVLEGFIESDNPISQIDEDDFSTYKAFCNHCGYGILKVMDNKVFGVSNKADYAFNRLLLTHRMKDMMKCPNYIGADIDHVLDEYTKCEDNFLAKVKLKKN